MINTLRVCLFCLLSLPVIGQEKMASKEVKNQVNFTVTDIFNGMYSFSYERKISKHFTVDLGFGYKTDEGLIAFSGIDREQLKTNDITYSGFKIEPEFRYYIEESDNGAMLSGFYMGAYLKYSNFKSDLIGTFIDSDDISYAIAYAADLSVTSVGLMIGYKLPIKKHFFIDFLIAGPGSGSYKFDLETTQTPPDEFYDVLNDALDDYSLFDLINSDFKFSERNLDSKFSVFSFRYGISVGYSF